VPFAPIGRFLQPKGASCDLPVSGSRVVDALGSSHTKYAVIVTVRDHI
jgi:hypothetical protein